MLGEKIIRSLRDFFNRRDDERREQISTEIAGDIGLTALFIEVVAEARALKGEVNEIRRKGRGDEYSRVPLEWGASYTIAAAADDAAVMRAVADEIQLRRVLTPITWWNSVPGTGDCLRGMRDDFRQARRELTAPQPGI